MVSLFGFCLLSLKKKSLFIITKRLFFSSNYLFTASANSVPALNFTTFLAGTLITSPVRGFLASLASLSATDQAPKPTIETLSPLVRAFSTLEKNASTTDDWKQNYHQKKALLEELKQINDEEGSVEKIEQIKSSWDSIGKVPRNKMSINNEFNKVLKEKLKLNKINVFDLKEENLTEAQLTDKARKIKSQIADLEAEVVKLENNINFFNNPSRENPLLKDTYDKIDEKKALIESLKQSLHKLITGE